MAKNRNTHCISPPYFFLWHSMMGSDRIGSDEAGWEECTVFSACGLDWETVPIFHRYFLYFCRGPLDCIDKRTFMVVDIRDAI